MADDWIKELKAGDRVVARFQGFGKPRYEIATVERTTATQVVLAGRGRFRKSDGMSIGNTGWQRTWLHRLATADDELEEQERILRSRFTDKLNAADWSQVPVAKLRRIAAILDEPKEGTDAN